MKQLLRPCVVLSLVGTFTAVTAQGVLRPCNSLPPGERESAQAIGACREGAPIVDVVPKGVRGTSSVVVPVPRVVGLSFDDARSRLGNFTVRRSYVASAEPGGTVLEQQPAPPVRLGAGGVVRVVVSDGSLRPAPQVSATEIDGVRKPVEAPPLPPVPIARSGAPQSAAPATARSDDARRATPPNSPLSRSTADSVRQAPASKSASTSRSSAARSDARTGRTKAEQIPPRSAVAQSPATVTETLELPNVIGRTSAAASAALAEFKVERIEVIANAAPSGQVLAQDPAPGTQVPVGTSIGLRVSDGSLASVSTIAPPVTSTAEPSPAPTVAPSPAPTVAPSPAPTLASSPAPERAAAPVPARAPMTIPSTAVLLLIAGVLLGVGLGALFMRRWLARRHAADTEAFVPTVVPLPVEPVERERVAKTLDPVALSLPAIATAPITFAARLEEGETTLEFAAPSDADEMTLEYSRDFHE